MGRRQQAIQDIANLPATHLRVWGCSGSGKTSALVERFQRYAHEIGNQHNLVAALTYGAGAVDTIAAALLSPGSARIGRPGVFNYHRLATQVLEGLANAPELIAEPEEHVLLQSVLRDATLVSDFKNISTTESFRRTVLAFFHTLQQNGVASAAIARRVERCEDPRLRDLLAMFVGYAQELASHNLATYHDITWHAVRHLADAPSANPLARTRVLLIDDFHDIDPGQYALVRAVAPAGGEAAITAFVDPAGARFGRRGTSSRFAAKRFPNDYDVTDHRLPWIAPDASMVPVLRAVAAASEQLDPEGYASEPVVTDTNVEMRIAEDDHAEVAWVANQCREAIASGTRPERIVIAARQAQRYGPMLASAMWSQGIGLRTDAPALSAWESFLEDVIRFAANPWSDTRRDRVARSPFFAAFDSRVRVATGVDEAPSAVRVDRRVSFLSRPMTELVRRGRHADLLKLINDVLVPMAEATAGSTQDSDARRAVDVLLDLWHRFCAAVLRSGAAVDLEAFAGFYSLGRRPSRSTTGVHFCELSDVSRSAEIMFVLGCAEGLCPAPPPTNRYLPIAAAQRLFDDAMPEADIHIFAATGRGDSDRQEHALLLSAISRTGSKLIITAPKKYADQAYQAPATILNQIPVAGLVQRLAVPHHLFAHSQVATREPLSLSGPAFATPRAWVSTQPERRPLRLEIEALSPSALKNYSMCPRHFFYERALGVKRPDTVYTLLGSFLHSVMEEGVRQALDRSVSLRDLGSDNFGQIVENVLSESREFTRETMVGVAMRQHLKEMALNVAEIDFDRDGSVSAIDLEQGLRFPVDGFMFSGKLDRIDHMENGELMIVDYKTGQNEGRGATKRREKALAGYEGADREWQVPMYLLSAKHHYGRFPTALSLYLVATGEKKPVAVTFFVGDESMRERKLYPSCNKSYRAHFTSEELESLKADLVAASNEICGQRDGFDFPENRDDCYACKELLRR